MSSIELSTGIKWCFFKILESNGCPQLSIYISIFLNIFLISIPSDMLATKNTLYPN